MSLQLACNLTEGKSFGGRRTFATDKAILMSTLVRLVGSLKANLDKKMIAQAVADYDSLKEEFKVALFGILGSYQRGEIKAEVMEEMWRSEIRNTWEKAYGLGIRSVGNPFGVWEQDKTWLKGAEAEEFGYLGKFAEDIKKNELAMGIEDRLGMYVETLDSVYFHGQVEGSPEFVKIIWHLRDSKHCNDCIKLAAGSPYTKTTLPTVPRSGDSRCLSNCKCFLEFKYADEKPAPELYVIKGSKPIVPPEGYRLPSDKERDKLGQMSSEIDRLRGLISATSGDQKKELIRMRRDLNADLIDFMEKHKIYYVPGGQVQKVKFVESIADEVKKELLLEGGPGSGHFGHKGRPGKRGGSLPGGGVVGHGVAGSNQMAGWLKAEAVGRGKKFGPGEAIAVLKNKFPGQSEERYARALAKTGLVTMPAVEKMAPRQKLSANEVAGILKGKGIKIEGANAEEKKQLFSILAEIPKGHLERSGVNEIWITGDIENCTSIYEDLSGEILTSGAIDGFYMHSKGIMAVSDANGRYAVMHEFAHSLESMAGKVKGDVWRANASTGKISRYGANKPSEGWAEGYAMFLTAPQRLKRKAPEIYAIYEKVFAS